jgi:hypothetical protein
MLRPVLVILGGCYFRDKQNYLIMLHFIVLLKNIDPVLLKYSFVKWSLYFTPNVSCVDGQKKMKHGIYGYIYDHNRMQKPKITGIYWYIWILVIIGQQ